jgi:3-deoxy-D-arabino-heptulosonate 7-phosphate (DAHP) synthase class II
MKSKMKAFFSTLVVLGLLASCAHLDPHPMDMTNAIRNAKTSADHNALATHYENTAKRMQAKAQEQKNQLAEYETHGYYYGRQTEDLKDHTVALARLYEEAADTNMNLAKSHRRMADQAK